MKKIFIVTGEPSGDKLASSIISKLKKNNYNIEYLAVGGYHLQSLDIKSIFDLKEITYLGFTSVLFNIFKIRKKINKTVEEIIKFQPDILFTVDSPDFTLRVAERVKQINKNTQLEFNIDFELKNSFLNIIMKNSFNIGLNKIADAFENRAKKYLNKRQINAVVNFIINDLQGKKLSMQYCLKFFGKKTRSCDGLN